MATPEQATRKIVTRLLLVGAVRVVVAGGGLGFSLVAARILGPAETGTLFVAISLVVGFSLLARMGNDVNLIWRVSHEQGDIQSLPVGRLLSASMIVGIVLCMIIWAALWVVAKLDPYAGMNPALLEALLGLFLLGPALTLSGLFAAVLKGAGQGDKAAMQEQGAVFAYALPMLLFCLFSQGDLSVERFRGVLVVGGMLMGTLGGFWCWQFLRGRPPFRPEGGGRQLRRFLRSSLTMGSANLAAYLIHWGPLVIVGTFAGDAESGYYAIAERVAVMGLFPLSVVNIVFAHQLAKYQNIGDDLGMMRVTSLSSGFATLGALPVVLLCVLLGDHLVRFLAPGFGAMLPALAVLSLGFLFSALLGSGSYLLMAKGKAKVLSRILWGSLTRMLHEHGAEANSSALPAP